MVGYVNYRSYNFRICMVLGYIISGISYKWDMSKVGHVIRAPLGVKWPILVLKDDSCIKNIRVQDNHVDQIFMINCYKHQM